MLNQNAKKRCKSRGGDAHKDYNYNTITDKLHNSRLIILFYSYYLQ